MVADNKGDINVYCLGDVNWDVLVFLDNFPDEDKQVISRFFWLPGGEAQNTARRLWELGANVKLVGRVGDDDLGAEIRRITQFEDLSIDEKAKTGITFAFVFKDGSRSFITDPGANANLDWSQVKKDDIESTDFVFKGGYWHNKKFREAGNDERLFKLAKDLGKPTGLNLGWNYTGWTEEKRDKLMRVIALTDYLFLNEDEAVDITGEKDLRRALSYLSEMTRVVLHRGPDGCLFKSQSVEAGYPVEAVHVQNPVGAGDAFNAGFILGLLQTNDIGAACNLGNKTAAEYISKQPKSYISRKI
uniref:Sugar kinase ribokinase family n=1 Tax=uncultured euryarchaeote Alv-FOS5 TaxID=337891 RepID=Q3SBA9_9EURY|nr:sugar kinase ribokinase family [uncultured euryarchaeote Alv-FOS5]